MKKYMQHIFVRCYFIHTIGINKYIISILLVFIASNQNYKISKCAYSKTRLGILCFTMIGWYRRHIFGIDVLFWAPTATFTP